ncbi:MAG: hypothetical protein HY717_03910 [Planctomycetes bacterium]|nr:hypothetical protein [Planctomycetota bacterium]
MASGLRVDPAAPFHPRYGDRFQLLLGASDRAALTIWQSEKGFDWRRYLEVLASNGFNYVRQDVTAWIGLGGMRDHAAQFSRPRWAFARTGPGTASDGGPRFDLTRLDEGYFTERLVPFLAEAERLGIIVELTLFEDCSRRRVFEDSLYAEPNNVNQLGLQPGDDPHAHPALRNARLLAIQEGYAARVTAATARCSNVIYEIANETGGAQWIEHFVDFIHRRRPGALVSAGEMSTSYDPARGRCDLIAKHRGSGRAYRTVEDVARHRESLVAFRRAGKPVLHNEFFLFANRSTDDPDFVRWMFWADFTGCGHANFYDFTWWRGTGKTASEGARSQPPPAAVLNAGCWLRRFVEEGQVRFWAMAPQDELLGRSEDSQSMAFVLGRPGEAYVVYVLAGGRMRLDLRTESGVWSARWFDPREGKFGLAFNVQSGRKEAFKAPDEKDWTLLLQKTKAEPK